MANLVERIVSALSYFTFGIFGIIWIIYVNVVKQSLSKFTSYNIYQSIMMSLVLAIIAYSFDLLLRLGVIVPFLGRAFKAFDLFFNQTPIYFGFSISGLIISVFLFYLIIVALLGKKPFVPFISDIIDNIVGYGR